MKRHTSLSLPVAFFATAFMLGCEQASQLTDAPPIAQAPPGGCSPWPDCKDDDGDGGGNGGGGGGTEGGSGTAELTDAMISLTGTKGDGTILLTGGSVKANSFSAVASDIDEQMVDVDMELTDADAAFDNGECETTGKNPGEVADFFTDEAVAFDDVDGFFFSVEGIDLTTAGSTSSDPDNSLAVTNATDRKNETAVVDLPEVSKREAMGLSGDFLQAQEVTFVSADTADDGTVTRVFDISGVPRARIKRKPSKKTTAVVCVTSDVVRVTATLE